MKVQVLVAALAAAVLVSACGDKHEKVHAVDKVAEAEAAAIEKAPKAEEVKFDDHGQPTFVEASGATTTTPATDSDTEASTDAAVTTESK
ncbi:hypothetical protein MOVS_02110 [Moraxella ovis]|uniref:Lipoprotein n=1 Tax=Moraxella ovis TaxID=29433 RepID=A0A378PI38_9GAMM|nr:hypothetical protein [Moraxella ovis]ANB90989.1 hypothetical protein MOVS_02110 [Moraxella ovis]STY86455.1 Uncharacterised protein [Moraxella ovis]